MSHSATPTSPAPPPQPPSSWRQVPVRGPQGLLHPEGPRQVPDGIDGAGDLGWGEQVLATGGLGVLTPKMLTAACQAGGYQEVCRRVLTRAVTTLMTVGLYLFAGVGYAGVLARMWQVATGVHPVLAGTAMVTAQAFSTARVRVGSGPLASLFTAHAAAVWTRIHAHAHGVATSNATSNDVDAGGGAGDAGVLFGLVTVAVDGTALDAPDTPYPAPAEGLYPQLRLVTLVHTATRACLAAVIEAITTSEQALWDRLVVGGHLKAGMLVLADRNFFSFTRWCAAAKTGAELAWRVKNGARSLPARIIETLPDGSHLVRLHENDQALRRRRVATGDPRAPRAEPVTARLVEFTVISRDEYGATTTSRFRVLTTLTDPAVAPAAQVAAGYARRWAVEVTYKILKSVVRGGPVRLRAQRPDTVVQEVWALLVAFNILIEHAAAVADDLGIEVAQVSVVAVLRALRDHLAAGVRALWAGAQPGSAAGGDCRRTGGGGCQGQDRLTGLTDRPAPGRHPQGHPQHHHRGNGAATSTNTLNDHRTLWQCVKDAVSFDNCWPEHGGLSLTRGRPPSPCLPPCTSGPYRRRRDRGHRPHRPRHPRCRRHLPAAAFPIARGRARPGEGSGRARDRRGRGVRGAPRSSPAGGMPRECPRRGGGSLARQLRPRAAHR
ncbi:IS4 family transposase [Quadrisphaera granulorum]|uniref:IS4 family transposase n=1 Tax=Quadrisphaera granulorum TaxID=317664 RepID=UPI000D6AB3C0|nr:IS4 family transposase [Quadrisphaera granulorum]